MGRKQYDRVSLRCFSDDTVVGFLIEIIRDASSTDLPTSLRPSKDDTLSVVAELLTRLAKGRQARQTLADLQALDRETRRAQGLDT